MREEKDKQPVISMEEAVKALHLDFPIGQDDVYALCPECKDKHSGYRETLNINYRENVFRCARCSFHGGVYALVFYYTGWKMNEVKNKILSGELKDAKITITGQQEQIKHDSSLIPMAPLQQRHRVYTEMMRIMELSDSHRKDLLKRGLSNEDIERIGFKSIRKFSDPAVIPKKLVGAGFDLRGVPGFGLNNGAWNMSRQPDDGFLVPLRNGKGLILGFQIRFDNVSDTIPKYGYLTSKGMENGTRAGGWVAWAGPDVSLDSEPFDIILTEGALKGYIINARTGQCVLSLPGVSALKKALPAIQMMQKFGLQTVYIAYDMDSHTNPDVRAHLEKLRQMLSERGVNHKTLQWKQFKGLDDWLLGKSVFVSS